MLAHSTIQTTNITVPMGDVVLHPLQKTFDACTVEENDALKASIERNGLDVLVEVFAAVQRDGRTIYVIRDGSRRIEALRQLGHTQVRVRVRLDLTGPETAEGMLSFLRANAERRQLGTLQRVRVAVRQYEILHAKGKPLTRSRLQAAREQIGKLIGMSGRNLARYLRLCRTPLPVQEAVSRDRLRLIVAERVADAGPAVQEVIAKVIETDGVDDLTAIVMQSLNRGRPATRVIATSRRSTRWRRSHAPLKTWLIVSNTFLRARSPDSLPAYARPDNCFANSLERPRSESA